MELKRQSPGIPKMKIYYAHCRAIYDTPQEQRDIDTLQRLGFEVENPNSEKHSSESAKHNEPMGYFVGVVKECDALAFRGLVNGTITNGVAIDIAIAREFKKPVIELPSMIYNRILSKEQTLQVLEELGER